ncbi:MAG: dockerin type I domain-containing protein, partial [Verrucomicrobiota bacterium]
DGGSAAATQSVAGAVVTVNMTGVTDQHNYVVTLTNVNDGTGTGNVVIPIGILRGDTNGDRTVNAGDALQTRNRSGQTADGTNFRSDVNTDGTVNSGDILTVRNASGGFLP